MTRPTQIILGLLVIIMAQLLIIGLLREAINARDRTIEHQRRSIEHGAAIAKARLQAGEALARYLDEERARSLKSIAEINELKAKLNAPLPTRPVPRSKRELRDSFHRSLDAR